MLSNSEIAIIIVTYQPDWKIIEKNIKELGKKYNIYISDNGSNDLDVVAKNIKRNQSVSILNNKRNLGIGKAQNLAIEQIEKDNQSKYIFFLDQDSFITLKNLELLLQDLKKLQKKSLVGSLAASSRTVGSNIIPREELISSGMLVPMESIKEIGLMNSDLFIDMVDYEWCWRANSKGFTLYEDERVIFKHQIGSEQKVLGKQIIAPFRLYYVFRNTLYLVNKPVYKQKKKRWVINLFKQTVFNSIFCPEKKKRIFFIYRGIKDAKKCST